MADVIQFYPTALATVVGLPFEASGVNADRMQAVLRLRRYVRELEPREEAVVAQLFGLYGPDKSVREVARQLKLTPEAVVRIEERALGELRRKCGLKMACLEAA